jgi:hypothetical protein
MLAASICLIIVIPFPKKADWPLEYELALRSDLKNPKNSFLSQFCVQGVGLKSSARPPWARNAPTRLTFPLSCAVKLDRDGKLHEGVVVGAPRIIAARDPRRGGAWVCTVR